MLAKRGNGVSALNVTIGWPGGQIGNSPELVAMTGYPIRTSQLIEVTRYANDEWRKQSEVTMILGFAGRNERRRQPRTETGMEGQ